MNFEQLTAKVRSLSAGVGWMVSSTTWPAATFLEPRGTLRDLPADHVQSCRVGTSG